MEGQTVPDWVVQTLRSVQALSVRQGPGAASVTLRVAGGSPATFEVASIPIISRELAQVLAREPAPAHRRTARPRGRRRLIAAGRVAGPARQVLMTQGMSWVERRTGACHLVAPGLLIDIRPCEERTTRPAERVRARLRGRSGWLAEIILQNRPREPIALAWIAREAGISLALASRLMRRLTELRLFESLGSGPHRTWRLLDAAGLLDLWAAEEQPGPAQAVGLYVWSQSAARLYERLAGLDRLGITWALGGTAAANLYAPTLSVYPDPTVWVPRQASPAGIVRTLGGELAEKGANLHLWQAGADMPLRHAAAPLPPVMERLGGLRLVSRPRAYVEAMAGAGRSAEVAQNLRRLVLHDDA